MSQDKSAGRRGEDIAIRALARIGVLMPEEVGTPFRITRRKKSTSQGVWLQGHYKKKVSGDHRVHREDGISILVETKTVRHNLRLSDFKDHQPGRLDQHANHAISLVVWVHAPDEVFIMNWLDVLSGGFGPGKGITPEQAARLNITDIMDCPIPWRQD